MQRDIQDIRIVELNAELRRRLGFDFRPRRKPTARAVEQAARRNRFPVCVQLVLAKKHLMRRMRSVRLVLIDERRRLIGVIVDVVRRIEGRLVVVRDHARARHGHEVRERIVERAQDHVRAEVVGGPGDVVRTALIERIVEVEQDADGAVAALVDEIEAVIEELAEHREPGVERRGEAAVRRNVRDEPGLRVVGRAEDAVQARARREFSAGQGIAD